MDDASFCSAATFDETAQTLSVSTLGRPSEVLMTATQGASTAAGAGGRSPPFRGRTMKEYEEMLAQLRKENFNLKLRLYFLEERAGAAGEGGDGEAGAAVRSELERLRREAAEKQQLLCEAARAVELLEEQHREQLRAARAAAQQAQAEAQKARAEAQRTRQVACAAEVTTSESDEEVASGCAVSATAALFARIEEADAEVTAAREAAARAAAEAALQAEEMRHELRQAREVALEAAEAARAARAVGSGARSPPRSPASSSTSSSCEGERLRGAVERAQAQLAALEAELGAVRAELRRQTEARAAAERGLEEGRAMHAKSLQTVQALARLCKERSREADGLRARLKGGSDADAAAATPATPATPPRSPSRCEENDGAVSDTASAHSAASASAASDKSATLPSTVTRRQVEQLRSFLDQKKEQLLKLAAERDELSSSLLCRLQLLQARAQEQEAALAARETQLRQAEERARRLEEEVALLRAPPSAANANADSCTEPGDVAVHVPGSPPAARTSPAPGTPPPARTSPSLGSLSLTRMSPAPESPPADRTSPAPGSLPPSRTSPAPGSPPPARTPPPPARTSPAPVAAAAVEEEDEKDRVIARLSAELRRRTANLQELVNKELWDKNRQIERLQARLTRMGTPAATRSTPVPTPATTPTSTHASDTGARREGDGGEGEEETEATLRRQLAEGVCERERLAAQLEELRRRALLPALPPPAADGCSSCDAARDALARAEAGRRDALAACAALARRLDALARALPPLLRRRHRHRPRHARRAPAGGDADVDVLALSGGDAPGDAGGGGGGGGRKLSALERALASAARAARALASLDQQGSAGAAPRARASESEVDAWSEPDRTVSLARVGLSPLSERRAAVVAAAGSVSSEDDAAAARAGLRAKSLTMGLGLAMGLEEEELLLDEDDIDRSDSEENYSSDETIDSESSRFRILESSEMQRLRSRVADLETRVSEKDNELLEQQCAMLEMRNTYTARCMEAENQLAELLAHVRQVQADAEVERRYARNQVQLQGPLEINSQDNGICILGNTTGKLSRSQLEQDKLDVVCDVEDNKMPQQPHNNKEEKERQEEKNAGKAELVVEVHNEAETEQRGAEVEAERRMRLAEAALVRQRDAAAVARARSALERTQLMGERLRLERALRREEAAAATAARQHRRERTQLHEHILQLSRRLHAALTTNAGAVVAVGVTPPPSPTPATTPTPTAGTLSPCPSLLQLQQLPYASPSQTSTEACVWTISHPPGEPSHGAGSPDLGIESDAGRFSSLEPLSSNCGSCDQEGTQSLCGFQGTDVESEFTRLQRENSNLKRNLSRTKKLLEATVTQLSSSNELKRQMELVICRQLNKTKCVLKEAKGDDEVSIEPVK